jgi:hypothetical protein
VFAAVRAIGLVPVGWNVVMWDWLTLDQEERLRRALPGMGAGSIVLAHDSFADHADAAFDGPAPDVDRVDLTRRLLEYLQEAGLPAVSLGTALGRSGPQSAGAVVIVLAPASEWPALQPCTSRRSPDADGSPGLARIGTSHLLATGSSRESRYEVADPTGGSG